jgi:DNA-directed RNA polymerase specialized sigma54-like protein
MPKFLIKQTQIHYITVEAKSRKIAKNFADDLQDDSFPHSDWGITKIKKVDDDAEVDQVVEGDDYNY